MIARANGDIVTGDSQHTVLFYTSLNHLLMVNDNKHPNPGQGHSCPCITFMRPHG